MSHTIERSAVVPLDLDETWHAFYGNGLRNWRELSDMVIDVREFHWRDDGTPEYLMVNRSGPFRVSHRSSYVVYEPPHRAEDIATETSLAGRWLSIHEPTTGGTMVTHRWHVRPRGVMRVIFPLIRRKFAESFQRDLDVMVNRISERLVDR